MSRKSLLIIVLVSFFFVFSCATLQQLVKKPEVTFESMSMRDMSLFEGTMVFHLKVSNPNPIGVHLSSLKYNLKINNKDFLNGVLDLDKGMTLRANNIEPIELPVTINYLKFLNSVSEFITKDEVSWNLTGSFQVMGFDIPYHANGQLAIPKLPKVSLRRVDVSKISFTGASLVFLLDIENKNPFAVNLNGLDYSIKVNNSRFASGKTKKTTHIGNNRKSTLNIPVDVSFMELGRSAYNLLKKSSAGYELSGNMVFSVSVMGEKNFPFLKTGKVILRK